MGISGLTTYINNRQDLYFDKALLKDCALVIDGNSLVPYLYNSSLTHTSAYGGDYDRISELTEKFFRRLAFNKVYAIVVFDGAVEKRKLNTIKSRAKNKIMSLQNVTPHNTNSQCFPMLMRTAMREKLIDMGVPTLQTDLEADCEIAALSKIYNIPVLSNDSDYFIFDVMYIPIPTLKYCVGTNSKIECQVFRIDKFLRHLDLDVKLLPLLAVVLGNDYIPRTEFRQFLGQIKLDRYRQARSQNIVAGVLRWLKSESPETGLQKVLSCMRSRGRVVLRQKMIKIMRGYTNVTTVLTEYLQNVPNLIRFEPSSNELTNEMSKLSVEADSSDSDVDEKLNDSTIENEDSLSDSDDVNYCSSEEGGDMECPSVKESEVGAILEAGLTVSAPLPDDTFPKWLMDKSRVGLVHPDILTLINLKAFFSTPQPECYDMTFSGEPYMRVLQCIAGLLLGPTEIHCWYRQHRNKYEETMYDTITETQSLGKFPMLETMDKLGVHVRKKLFHEILDVEDQHLSNVPNDWKLYIISVSYWLKNDPNNELKPYHLHSVIMMMLTLLVVDTKIGFYRQRKSFVKKYGAAIAKISETRRIFKPKSHPVFDSISDGLGKITREDCILAFDGLLQHFQVDSQKRYSKQFSSTIVHAFARLQHCINFTFMLNTVLCSPYPDSKVHAFYNGTFLYNTAVLYKKKTNIVASVDTFLANVPSLLGLYKVIYNTFQQMCSELLHNKPRKKTRKTKTIPVNEAPKEELKFDSDSEPFYDRNNRFSTIFY